MIALQIQIEKIEEIHGVRKKNKNLILPLSFLPLSPFFSKK